MHLTSSPCFSANLTVPTVVAANDDRILHTLMEADAAVRTLLLAHLCDGDEVRRERLNDVVEAALRWREADADSRILAHAN